MAAAVQQEAHHAVADAPGTKPVVVVQHGRDDAGRAVGRRGDDAAAGRILLVDRERVQRHPVHRRSGSSPVPLSR